VSGGKAGPGVLLFLWGGIHYNPKKMKELKEFGDLLEREYYDFILDQIPSYKCIWEKVIGQNYVKTTTEQSKDLRRIAEYQYTCLESIICIKLINKKKSQLDISQPSVLLKNSLELVNDFLLFEVHMGRIYETLERIWTILKMDKNEKMKEFYHHRHNVIHSHKLPFKIDEGYVFIPKLKAQNHSNINKSEGWDDRDEKKRTWDDFLKDDKELQFLTDYFNDTEKRLIESFEIALKSILSKLKSKIKNISTQEAIKNKDPIKFILSGTTISVDNSVNSLESKDKESLNKKNSTSRRKKNED
jgi:hypothetical protein